MANNERPDNTDPNRGTMRDESIARASQPSSGMISDMARATALPPGAVPVQGGRWVRQESDYGPVLVERSNHPDVSASVAFDQNQDGRLQQGEIRTPAWVGREGQEVRLAYEIGRPAPTAAEERAIIQHVTEQQALQNAAIQEVFAKGYATREDMNRIAEAVGIPQHLISTGVRAEVLAEPPVPEAIPPIIEPGQAVASSGPAALGNAHNPEQRGFAVSETNGPDGNRSNAPQGANSASLQNQR